MLVTGAEAEYLVSAIKNGIVDVVVFAFENELYVNNDRNYSSVLSCATYYGKFSIVSLLLRNEKLIEKTDLDSSLHIATMKGHTDVVELLLKHGANIEFEYNGMTPLRIAVTYNYENIVNILIEAGANVNVRNKNDDTYLHVACQKGFLSIVKLLLDAGVGINVQNLNGSTPLSYATFYNNYHVLKLLLDRGADVTITDNLGNTVLHGCVGYRPSKLIIKLLLKNGACVNSRNVMGNDVLDLAELGNITKSVVRLTLYFNINIPKPDGHQRDGISKFWDSCKSELELMETCKIAESNISYRKLLLERDKNKLAAYFSNADIVSELDTLVYKKKFPIYREYITKNISKGNFRLHLYHKADEVMNHISPFLPMVVRSKIFNYLLDSDLKNLTGWSWYQLYKEYIMKTGADKWKRITDLKEIILELLVDDSSLPL